MLISGEHTQYHKFIHKYFFTIVDNYLSYTWIFHSKQKFEVFNTSEIFVAFI